MEPFRHRPGEIAEGACTVVVLPDTQRYSQESPEIFERQTRWIAAVAAEENVQFVVHVGDVVHQPTDEQFRNADKAVRTLDEAGIPYGIAIGNHDYDRDGGLAAREATRFDACFGPDRFADEPWWGGTYDPGTIHNAYAYFSDGGRKYLVLFLELFPRPEVVEWANDILEQNAAHEAILVTHGYLNHDSTRIDENDTWDVTHYEDVTGLNGPDIWERVVEPNDNVFLVLSGHVLCDGSARLASVRDDGSVVHQILTNYQTEENGGNGYLRLLRFHPPNGCISVETYSPSLEQRHPRTNHHFVLEYPFDG